MLSTCPRPLIQRRQSAQTLQHSTLSPVSYHSLILHHAHTSPLHHPSPIPPSPTPHTPESQRPRKTHDRKPPPAFLKTTVSPLRRPKRTTGTSFQSASVRLQSRRTLARLYRLRGRLLGRGKMDYQRRVACVRMGGDGGGGEGEGEDGRRWVPLRRRFPMRRWWG